MRSAIVAIVVALAGFAQAGEVEIIGFDTTQGFQFQGGTVSNFYTLEFAQTIDGP